MLSLVAGPTDIVPLDPLDAGPVLVEANVGLWVDGLGLVIRAEYGSSYYGHLYAVQLDGTSVHIGGSPNLQAPTLGWAAELERPVFLYGASGWQFCILPSCARIGQVYRTMIEGSPVGAPVGVLPDRLIQANAGLIKMAGWDVEAEWLGPGGANEYDFHSSTLNYHHTILVPGGLVNTHRRWWLLDSDNGRVYGYDSTAKTECGQRTSLGSAFRLAGYSVSLDLFFTVRRDSERGIDQLYVYANEPTAASLSGPAFMPAPKRGSRSRLTSQVLGDLGEPCAGRNVEFAVSAGTLEAAVVPTDAQGIATTYYRGPADGAPSGATATATLAE